MECNKDEAIRAKDIAVRKFTENDFSGAKRFALKAQTLYPPLEGISQMLTALSIYISAENKTGGETDYYSILGVNPLADDDTIKKQYRKLLLLLHPDKNKFIGADGAFLQVSEAFNFLSDKDKRSAYNTRHHIRIPEKVSAQSQNSFAKTTVDLKVPAAGNYGQPYNSESQHTFGKTIVDLKVPAAGIYRQPCNSEPNYSFYRPTVDLKVPAAGIYRQPCNSEPHHTFYRPTVDLKVPAAGIYRQPCNSESPLKVKTPKVPSKSGANGCRKRQKSEKGGTLKKSQKVEFVLEGDTFWTRCLKCNIQYEYSKMYLGQLLKCQTCEAGFMAVEIPPPSNLTYLPADKQRNAGPHVSRINISFYGTNARWCPYYGNNSVQRLNPQQKKERLKKARVA